MAQPDPVTVTVRTLDGTATVANGDYVAIAKQVVTFAPGQTTATVPVTVIGKVATHTYFGLQVTAPYTGVAIVDDYGRANLLGATDLPHDFVYAGTAAVIQTTTVAQTAELPVTSSAHTDTISCTVKTTDGTAVAASGDYTAIVNGTVTLAPGQTSTTIPITIPPGTNIQPNRQFTVTIGACTNSNDIAEDPTGTVTINGVQPPEAPVVTTNPTSQSVKSGVAATFTAAAAGSPTPTVQWMSEAPGATTYTAVSGATGLSYTLIARLRPERHQDRGGVHQHPGFVHDHPGHPDGHPGAVVGPDPVLPVLRLGARRGDRDPYLHGDQHRFLHPDHHLVGAAVGRCRASPPPPASPPGTTIAGGRIPHRDGGLHPDHPRDPDRHLGDHRQRRAGRP